MTTPSTINPARGEIWLVNFDPTVGDEIQKIRPAVVLSQRGVWVYKTRIVVPMTTWQARFKPMFWMVPITTNATNNLKNDSAANASHVKSIAYERFVRKLGVLTANEIDDITAAVALCIGFDPGV